MLTFVFWVINWLVNASFKAIATIQFRQFSTNLAQLRRTISSILSGFCIGLCLLVLGVNGVLIYQNKPVLEFYREWLLRIPLEFWINLAIALFKCISLLLLVKFSLPYLRRSLDWACRYAQNSDQLVANDESIQKAFATLQRILSTSIWLLALILCANFLQVPAIIPQYLAIALKAYLAISIGQLVVKATSVLIDTLDALSLRLASGDNGLRYYERFRHLVPALKKTLEYALYVLIAQIIVREIAPISWLAEYADEIVQTIGIYFLCGVIIEFVNILLEDLVLKTDQLTDLQRQHPLPSFRCSKALLSTQSILLLLFIS